MSSHYREMIVAEAIDVFVGAVRTHSELRLYFLTRAHPRDAARYAPTARAHSSRPSLLPRGASTRVG